MTRPSAEPADESTVSPLHATRPAVPPHQDQAGGFIAVLRRRDFRYLWGAQLTSQLADKFLMFTLLVFMYTLTKLASLQSVLMIAYTLPSVLLSAPSGVYADRHDKRTLMILCNVVRGGLVLLIPLAQLFPVLRGQAWPLVVITLLFSSAGQIFAPAEAASIPSLVTRRQITEATSLFMTTVILTLVLGVPAATIAIGLFGNQAPFYIASGLFGVAALSVWRVSVSLRAEKVSSEPSQGILRELRDGIDILRGSPALRLGLYQLALAIVVVFTIFALGPVYLVEVLKRSDNETYIVLVPAMFGLIATGALLGQRPTFSRATTLVAGIATAGTSLLIMGIVPDLLRTHGFAGLMVPLAVFVGVVFGGALGALLIPAFTVLQERTDSDSRGRIFGGIFTVINAAVAIPLLLAGVVSDLIGVARVVAALGALLLLVAAGVRWLGWNRLRVLEPDPTAHSAVVHDPT
ncbi:MAG TPA: MFS transporter [Candidatus Saccharimonadales bacterium]|nr:MFS transporter [Candidatus Saccharimonadales bacterium]